jgi:hypothetical protein
MAHPPRIPVRLRDEQAVIYFVTICVADRKRVCRWVKLKPVRSIIPRTSVSIAKREHHAEGSQNEKAQGDTISLGWIEP